MTSTPNAYCVALGITVPRLEDAKSSPDANYYSLLIIALLERGVPMTLGDVSARFAAAGVAPTAADALASLKRCKPARAPIYRDGDHYALDPHDDEVSFWLFRLGLRPARGAPLQVARPVHDPVPSPGQPVTVASLNEAWRDGVPNAWSAQRVAVAVLDAHDGAMSRADVLGFVATRSGWSPLRPESVQFWRSGVITVREDGLWMLDRSHDVVRSTREAVRDRVSDVRRWAAMRPDLATMEAHRRRLEREREAHAQQLAAMRRVLVHAFPASRPQALALVDVAEREVTTFARDDIARAVERLTDYEIIGAVGVRDAAPDVERRSRRASTGRAGPSAEDATTQSARPDAHDHDGALSCKERAESVGRSATIERCMSTCARGAETKLRRRLEADARSLYALYQYGRLHGCVRLRWGFLDEMLPAPWVHRDETTLYHLLKDAHERGVPLEVVVGSAPGWADPWARAQRAYAATDAWQSPSLLADEQGYEIPRVDVQLARLIDGARGTG